MLCSPTGYIHSEEDKLASNLVSSSNEEEPLRRGRREPRHPTNSNDFRVEIPTFKGNCNLDEFLEWLQTVECIFEYKDVSEVRHIAANCTN